MGVTFSLFQFVSRHENFFSGSLLPQPPASEQGVAASVGVTLGEAWAEASFTRNTLWSEGQAGAGEMAQ